MTWSNLRVQCLKVTIATNLPYCFSIKFLEQLLKVSVNFTLLKYVKSQRSYGFLITKELIFGFQILDLKDHFSASLTQECWSLNWECVSLVTYELSTRCGALCDPSFLSDPGFLNNSQMTRVRL